MHDLILSCAILGGVAVATVTDLRARRIPNALTLPLGLVGLALNALFFQGDGLLASAAGMGAGFGLLFPLFLFRGVGAGDVKLLMAIGALKGPEFVFFTCLWAGIAGGCMAVVGLLRSHKLGLALAHLYYSRFIPDPRAGFSAGRIPYAPALAIGALVTLGGVRWIGG